MAADRSYFRWFTRLGIRSILILGRIQKHVGENPPMDGQLVPDRNSDCDSQFGDTRSDHRDSYSLDMGTFPARFGICMDFYHGDGLPIYPIEAGQSAQGMDGTELCDTFPMHPIGYICFTTYHLFVRSTFIGKFLNGRKYTRSVADIRHAEDAKKVKVSLS